MPNERMRQGFAVSRWHVEEECEADDGVGEEQHDALKPVGLAWFGLGLGLRMSRDRVRVGSTLTLTLDSPSPTTCETMSEDMNMTCSAHRAHPYLVANTHTHTQLHPGTHRGLEVAEEEVKA